MGTRSFVSSFGLRAAAVGVVALVGCAAPTAPRPEPKAAVDKPEDVAAKAGAPRPGEPVTPGDAPDDASRAVIDSANDQVSRVTALLAQRAQARQMADDIAEQRLARGKEPNASAANQSMSAEPAGSDAQAKADEAAEIDRLAAELRRRNETAAALKPPAKGEPSASLTSPPPSVEMTRRDPAAAEAEAGLAKSIADRVNADPTSADAQLDWELLQFLRNQPIPDSAKAARLSSEDRELLSAVADALTNYRSVVRGNANAMGVEKARPFVELADRVRARSDLSIGAVALCKRVQAYGLYDPIEPARFTSGDNNVAIIYCEVDGFSSQLDEKGLWDTELKLGLRLFSENNLEVWSPPPEKVTDVARKRRRDFFIAKTIKLPPILVPGRYYLKATVEDLQAGRVAESTVPVDVVAK